MIYFKDFQEKEKSKTIVNLEYRNDKRTLELSVVNLEKDTLVFTLPKLAFSSVKEGKESAVKENNITEKPYINYLFINKTICYIQRESSEQKKIISIDSTMQRHEVGFTIKLGYRDKFVKKLYLDCEKSDRGSYEIQFFEKPMDSSILPKVHYPRNTILKIEK